MNITLSQPQLRYLNQLHNQAPALFVSALHALNSVKPGGIAAYRRVPPAHTLPRPLPPGYTLPRPLPPAHTLPRPLPPGILPLPPIAGGLGGFQVLPSSTPSPSGFSVPGLGFLGDGGNTNLLTGGNFNLLPSSGANAPSVPAPADTSGGFFSDLSTIFTAALPAYLSAKYIAPAQQQNAVTQSQTAALLQKMGVRSGLSATLPVLLIGGAALAALMLFKKKKKA